MRFLFSFFFACITFCVFAQNAGIGILTNINARYYPQWDKGMDYVSSSVYPALVVAPGAMLITGLATKNKDLQRSAAKTVISLGVNVIFTTGLKYAVNRPRPYETYPDLVIKRTSTGPYSFPSGHTSYAFSLATSATLATKKWYVAVPCYAYAGTVAYSRMRLGVHYPGDVLAGALIGIGSSLLTWKIDKWMNRPKPVISQVD